MAYTKYARPILERQPCLDIRSVLKLAGSASGYLHWRTRSEGVGHGDFSWLGVGRFSLEYEILPLEYVEPVKGRVELNVVFTPSKVRPGGLRFHLQCSCGGRTDRLYFYDERWACNRSASKTCHQLAYVSQRKSLKVRNSERVRVLRAEIGRGRPKGMHGGRYLKLLNELKNLEREVEYDGEQFASLELIEVVFLARCVGSPDPPKGFDPLPELYSSEAAPLTGKRARELDRTELPANPKWYVDEFGDPALFRPRLR